MNRFHRYYCASPGWARLVQTTLVPAVLEGAELGPRVLELGPGPGLTTEVLAGVAPELQDRLFVEVHRVLGPGGVFCGSDNPGRGLKFRLIHIGDNKTVVDPATLGERLHGAGFEQARIRAGSRIVFHARRPR
jgi:hypothetical protein